MNRNDIIKTLKMYNFNKENYIVISGAAMVLLGIKEITNDIDISVTDEYYRYLLKNFECKFERINEYGEKVYFIDDLINFSRTYYKEDKYYIENIPIQSPLDIIELKKKLNRPKDIIDIEKINKYLEDNS